MIDIGSTAHARRPSYPGPSSDFVDSAEASATGSGGSTADEKSRLDLLGPLLGHLAELREYAGLYCAARLDRWRIGAYEFALRAVFGLTGGIFGITAVVVASALFVNGLATGIGLLCGGRIWLGQIILGGGLILIAFSSLGMVMRAVRVAERKRLVNKYEARKQVERANYGTDVAQRAANRGAL